MAASARRSRARRIASISTSSAPGSASGSRPWASRSSSIPASAATTPRSTPFATFSARRPFTPAEVDKIVVHGSQVTVDHVGWPYRPEGLTSAQLNLPFCVATLLLEGDVLRRSVRARCGRGSARASSSRARSTWSTTPPSPRWARHSGTRCGSRSNSATARREIETREAPRGSEQSFATADEIVDKFRKLTRGAMSEVQQAALIEAVLDMEQLPTSKRLAELLRQQ